jgi:bifunctional non-homologous end joining protein LigD
VTYNLMETFMATSSPASAPIRTVTLYKTEGSADKVYGLSIERTPGLLEQFHLFYQNGPRGGTMRKALKLAQPVTLEVANKEFDKVQKAKMKDGYTPAESGQVYTGTEDAGRVSGVRPMLPADLPKGAAAATLNNLLDSDDWCMQEKIDGQNRPLIIADGKVLGANKDGLLVPIPELWQAAAVLGNEVLYGEHFHGRFHVFDLHDDALSFSSRYNKLVELLGKHPELTFIKLVKAVVGKEEKRAYLQAIDDTKGEGVVFKRLAAQFEEGKNACSYRHKLWETMTCFVTRLNTQRSVGIGANDSNGQMVALGNVTIPVDQAVPQLNALLEVRFLYWNEGGSLIQPTSLGLRTDVNPAKVTIDQITRIKRKGDAFDLDDGTLSDQTIAGLAVSEFEENLTLLSQYIRPTQIDTLRELAGQDVREKVQEVAHRIRIMHKGNDAVEENETAFLRYFDQDTEWLVTKLGATLGEVAFGASNVYGDHAPQHFSISKLLSIEANIDLFFEPQDINTYIQQKRSEQTTIEVEQA